MRIKLSVESYKGADGSSLTPTRCYQMILVYEMLEKMGASVISYLDIQNEADKLTLFGKTKAKSAIRTFFPLLKKIGFVDYEDTFVANNCFTELGKQFVLACRALQNITDDTPHKEDIEKRLRSIKQNAQCKGLLNMYNNPEYRSHNIWIALKLLKELKYIHWNEFLYSLYIIENGKTINDAILEIKDNKTYIDSIDFINDKEEMLPDTCYSYIRSYLEEAGIICKISSMESKLLDGAEMFYTQIDL